MGVNVWVFNGIDGFLMGFDGFFMGFDRFSMGFNGFEFDLPVFNGIE